MLIIFYVRSSSVVGCFLTTNKLPALPVKLKIKHEMKGNNENVTKTSLLEQYLAYLVKDLKKRS